MIMHLTAIDPTPFFARGADGSQQGVDVALTNDGPAVEAEVRLRIGATEARIALGKVEPGVTTRRIYVPDVRETDQAEFTLWAEGQVLDHQTFTWTPMRHWKIHVVPSSHHDLGYTDLPSNVLRQHDAFLDDVVHFCEETADWPEEARFCYVIEQGWSALHYVEHRPPEAIERLVRLMREGRIEVTALFGNEASELCGHEEQIRLAYPSFRLKRRYGIPIRTAELNDIPGVSWGLASVLAGCGVRYFAPGIPDYFAWGRQVHPLWDEEAVLPRDLPGAFWWEGPDGSRVLFWYGWQGLDAWTTEHAVQELSQRLRELDRRGYPFDLIRFRFQGGHRDNSPPDMRISLIAREWNSLWTYPKLIVSSNTRFFEQFERHAGERLRALRGDLPNTDYTAGATSTAKETGVNRLAHDTLTSAEKLAACAAQVSEYEYPAGTLAEAYDCALLYDEHTWGMAHPIGPAQEACASQKGERAYRAAALADDVLAKSVNRIVDQIALPEEGYHLMVFNPLAHVRTDVVSAPAITPSPCGRPMYWRQPPSGEDRPPMWVLGTAVGRDIVQLPLARLEAPFELVDLSTGQRVPYQIVTIDNPQAARPWAAYRYALGVDSELQHKDLLLSPAHRKVLLFVARDVPPVGYKTYRIVPAEAWPSFESTLQVGSHTLENQFYRVTLDPASGAVASILDKELGREWVDGEAAHGMNQLVVRSPQTGEALVASPASIEQGEAGPVAASLVVRGSAPGCPQLTQEITLYEGVKRIDLANRLLKDATPLQELYFAFPFTAEHPQFRYEASNSVIEPIGDQLPGSNTDAYAVQHWVAMEDGDTAVAWSSLEAPVVALGGLWPGYVSQAHHAVTPPGYGHEFLRDPAQLERGHIYSYAMVNNFRTNFQPVQVGDVLFRYALTSYSVGARSRAPARNFGWEVATPLSPVYTIGPQEGRLADSGSFCRLDQPNVILLTMKGAEDGADEYIRNGLILRLAETEGKDTTVTVTLPHYEITQAFETNLVEEDRAVLVCSRHTVRASLPANGIVTIRCRGSRHRPGW
jgi:hypothetical protein